MLRDPGTRPGGNAALMAEMGMGTIQYLYVLLPFFEHGHIWP